MPVPLIAIDVALLPRGAFADHCLALSAALPPGEALGLQLGPAALPHVTLTQQFVPVARLDEVYARVDALAHAQCALRSRVTGAARAASSVSLWLEPGGQVAELHERLMVALADLEVAGGEASAFADEPRGKDVNWVRGFRGAASFDRFEPHVTLGHAAQAPVVPPFDVTLDRLAVCHVGRFCSCRHVLRQWELP